MLNCYILQDSHLRNLRTDKFSDDDDDDDDIPSAPPIDGSTHEIKQAADRSPVSRVHSTPYVPGLSKISNKNDRDTSETTFTVKPENDTVNRNADQFVRLVFFNCSFWHELYASVFLGCTLHLRS